MERFDINQYMVTNYCANIGAAEHFLVGLYYQTGEKYRCTCLKIELLLIIYQLWCLKYNKTGLMPTKMANVKINQNRFRFTLPIVTLPSDITRGIITENKMPIKDEFLAENVIPAFYQEYRNHLKSDDKELLELIFRKFGNWSSKELALECQLIINETLSLYDNPEFITSEMINSQKLSSKLGQRTDNEIISFIYKNKPKSTNNKSVLNERKVIDDFDKWFRTLTFEEQATVLKNLNNTRQILARADVEKNKGTQKVKTKQNNRKL